MATPAAERMRQVHLGLASSPCPIAAGREEHAAHEAMLLARCPARAWPHASYRASCPRPVLLTGAHIRHLNVLHDALAAAIADIVPRWWRDRDAGFPERMPLPADEEELLQWLDEQEDAGRLGPFSSCQGSWRPDFLVEGEVRADGSLAENFRISEINARFCFNGFMHVAHGSAALTDMVGATAGSGLVAATDGEELFEGLLGLFRHDRPIHLLKGDEPGIDIHMFIEAARARLGVAPRLVHPSSLRLALDAHGRETLCCLSATSPSLRTAAGEAVEEMHQVGVELRQRELRALPPAIRRHLALRGVNDARTALLVHDKRMLGVVRQELGALVARGALTAAQAALLERGVAHTFLPGSPELDDARLLEDRAGYVLKPVRGGKGVGIRFGEDMDEAAWREALAKLRGRPRPPGDDDEDGRACVVLQRRVRQLRYELVLGRDGEVVRYPLVGTYHVVNGRWLGIGIWRSSGERVCAVSSGGSWMCSVVRS
ncbi:hypothetical protein ISF_07728 [Cordyceps fumosorosea ARSEF 2679]|uniref:Taurine catabolism dioxygenase TauD/TfdA n=1 Tax=Cordyceps fumosorosea (strain ARSEF 2679) TaxID=1081104 RepID=A0A167NJR2_CORFA|nr:hypothetical protein ISF_07728 [Cordyceps fumosorosea ARSEF 2679]OAA55623.1 hypothetical protein ISF_07728 [Cordyceps fumosorosea ARSEF 2679]